MEGEIVKYTASDGCDLELTPEIIAKYVVTGGGSASDKDIYSFLMKCKARGLNPLAGDCYMVSYGGSGASVITSKDYFMRTATSREDFDGIEAGVVVAKKAGDDVALEYREGSLVGLNEKLVGGWAKVHTKGRRYPSSAVVAMSEYYTGKSLWKSKPATMIRKVALVQAIREAYPDQFAGVYDSSEMPEHDASVEYEEVRNDGEV